MNKKQIQLLNTFSMLLTSIIWGSTFLMTKKCLESMDAVVLVGYRSLISSVIIALGLLLFRRNLLAHWRDGLILGFFMFLTYFGQTVGLKYVTISSSGFITGLFVVIVPILSCIFDRRRPTLNMVVAVLIALVGMWFITGGVSQLSSGDLLTLLCAVAFSFYVIFADKALKKNADPWVLNFQQFLVAGVASFVLVLFLHNSIQVKTLHVFYYIIYLAVFANVLAYGLQLIAQKHLSPVNIALLMALEPVFAAIFAWTLGGEEFKLSQGIGGLFIISAILFAELPLLSLGKKLRIKKKE